MHVSPTVVVSFLSLSLPLLVSADHWASYDSFSLEAREAYPVAEPHFDIYEREFFEREAEADAEAAFLEARKVKLIIPKKLKKGSIKQNELESTQDMGEQALKTHGCSAGEVVFGWHDERSEDPLEHFTINPTGSCTGGKGMIHVHRDGSSTQGKQRRSLEARKVKLTIPKKLKKGSIKQNELESTQDMGEQALKTHGCSAGEVVFGWHDERSEDPLEHFTINPTGSCTGGKGMIHVHRDGSSTQGKQKRDLETLVFHRRNLLEAREAYAEALDAFYAENY